MKYFVFEKLETKKCVNISKRMRSRPTYTYINQNRQIKQQQQQMTIATTTSPNLFLSENTL